MLSSDFHCKKNDGTTGAAHLIQTFFFGENQTPVVCKVPYSPDIRRYSPILYFIVNSFFKIRFI